MAKHLSAEQITKYRGRTLQPGELQAVDSHLGNCTDCRTLLLQQSPSGVEFLAAIEEAAHEHLTFEQMDAWADDQMDQTERELVMAHIGMCTECARQLKAYEKYAPVMSAPVHRAARQAVPFAAVAAAEAVTAAPASRAPKPTFGERLQAFFATPRMVAAMLTIAAAAIITPILVNQQSGDGGGGGDPVTVSSLESLPPTVRNGAEAVARALSAERPASLAGLTPNADPFLQYPVSEVVEDLQPELRWKPFASSYTVRVYNAQGMQIAVSDLITATTWLVPIPLDRGATYSYEVIGMGDAHRADFRVLSPAAQSEMAQLRAARAGEYFVLGTVAQQFGMLSVARQEFESLVRQQPQSKEAARMLSNVKSLIGR